LAPYTPTPLQLTSHAVLPVIRIGQTYSPCDMWETAPGVYVFDFCQNMAGITTLVVPEGVATDAGVHITMVGVGGVKGYQRCIVIWIWSSKNAHRARPTPKPSTARRPAPSTTFTATRFRRQCM
jgi:hypothetical protein